MSRENIHDKSVSEVSTHSIYESGLNGLLEMSSPGFGITFLGDRHPSSTEIVDDFMERAGHNGGHVEIVGSGPE